MTADVVDTAEYRRWYGLDKPWTGGGDIAFHLGQALDALDLARDRNAELMNDRTEALNGEALQRGRAHAAEMRIAELEIDYANEAAAHIISAGHRAIAEARLAKVLELRDMCNDAQHGYAIAISYLDLELTGTGE